MALVSEIRRELGGYAKDVPMRPFFDPDSTTGVTVGDWLERTADLRESTAIFPLGGGTYLPVYDADRGAVIW